MVNGTSTWSSRPHLGLIAQDSTRFPLSLFDNIDAGSGWSADQESVDRTVADAPLGSVVERAGLGVRLSANYQGGTDLSGGQWQRVAFARAVTAVHRGAGLLILDEPTSALDIQSEVALFDRLTSTGEDVTTVLVSHRLAGVRRADRILVLADDGDGAHVAEDGTHDELMRARGSYWAMFTLQASRFTQGGLQ
jgi:ABC-type multidrug transport system fused ATPase/permease subunit